MRYLTAIIVALCVPISVHALEGSAGVDAGPGVRVAWDSRFPPKPQVAIEVSASARLVFAGDWAVGIAPRVYQVGASSTGGWYSYRGYSGMSVAVLADFLVWSGRRAQRFMELGIATLLSGEFSRYTASSLYFFSSTIHLQPFLIVWPTVDRRTGLRFSVAAGYTLRPDLVASASLGMNVGIVLMIGRSRDTP